MAIATALNERGVIFDIAKSRKWYPQAVGRILRNPKYIGCNVYGRSSRRLGSPTIKLPSSMWTVAQNCWPPIVGPSIFQSAQQKFASQTRFKSDQQLITELSGLLQRKGKLTEKLVMQEINLPSQYAYRRRFGSMSQAFVLAGYKEAKLRAMETRRHLKELRNRLLKDLIASGNSISVSQPNRHFRPTVLFANRMPISVHLGYCFTTDHSEVRWLIRPVYRERKFVTLIARLNITNHDFQDYIVLPNLGTRTLWTMSPDDPGLKVGKRFASLSEFASAVDQLQPLQHPQRKCFSGGDAGQACSSVE